MPHDDILNITADLLTTVCKDSEKEPIPQPCAVTKDELGADIAVRGFWDFTQRAFVDVRAFYPFAQSYRHQSLAATMNSAEAKRRANTLCVFLMTKMVHLHLKCLHPMMGLARKHDDFTSN